LTSPAVELMISSLFNYQYVFKHSNRSAVAGKKGPDCASLRIRKTDDASAAKGAKAKISVPFDGCALHRKKATEGVRAAPLSTYLFFFLCLFLRRRFLRLCVAILCLFLFLPLGIG
jgi:hypothetical protein